MSNQSKREIDSLKSEVSKLFDDLGNIVQTLGDIGKAEAGEAKKKIEKEVGEQLNAMRERVDELRRHGKQVANTVTAKVEENPLTSLAIACGIGYILGKLLNRRD